jgi:hypothetical protein
MNSRRSVNEVLDQLVELEGQSMQLEGILEIHTEGYALKHYPNAERQSEYVEEGLSYQSGIWVEFGNGSIRPNDSVLGRWQGKRVRVYGVIHGVSSLSSGIGGFGPWGCWPVIIEPASIQRVTAVERRENGT